MFCARYRDRVFYPFVSQSFVVSTVNGKRARHTHTQTRRGITTAMMDKLEISRCARPVAHCGQPGRPAVPTRGRTDDGPSIVAVADAARASCHRHRPFSFGRRTCPARPPTPPPPLRREWPRWRRWWRQRRPVCPTGDFRICLQSPVSGRSACTVFCVICRFASPVRFVFLPSF